ncbi:hypothetical protein JMJ77_0001817 [Colletotrichum scovillei]|uniref:Uncharacterized protein n=1 Tax=Colletotrichum scovillei TaxID=1209932 RepID=A0A9P7R9K3_9PEZI|nr:hypothetical protein JMJ77_0001817 [Colletotrichum scovillei]KAG7070227.1 hypothetical protein JMJ76_0001483 [Colletotrichum scovillei]KAG7078477.1 hypothetical protein JMJ78_0002148 [Colletotrichum scovillei]
MQEIGNINASGNSGETACRIFRAEIDLVTHLAACIYTECIFHSTAVYNVLEPTTMMAIPRKPVPDITDASMMPRTSISVGHGALYQPQTSCLASNTDTVNEPTTETNSLTSDRTKSQYSKGSSSGCGWTLEICALVLSITALVTVAALLLAYDGKPLSTWSFFLTFNTIISFLGTISRTTLAFAIGACLSQEKWNWFRRKDDYVISYDRFEEAGRGPLGSVRLLWRIKHRHWVCFGALATIVLLGFEPFLQAVVELYEKEVESAGIGVVAHIGRVKRLDAGKIAISEPVVDRILMPLSTSFVWTETAYLEYDFGSLSAIWTAFNNLSSQSNQQPAFTCATGNCTWAPHASLAVCSACNDISSHLVESTGHAHTLDPAVTAHNFTNISMLKHPFTKFELPTMNLSISNFDDGIGLQVELTCQSTTQPGSTLSFQDSRALLVSFAMMSVKPSTPGSKRQSGEATALECALSFCTNIYRSNVNKGVLSEEVLGSYSIRNLDSYVGSKLQDSDWGGQIDSFKNWNKMHNYTLDFRLFGEMERTDLQLNLPSDNSSITALIDKDNLWFNISHAAAATLSNAFVEKFSRRSPPFESKQLIYPTFEPFQLVQPSVITALGTSQNLSATFEIAALAMTKWMRDASLKITPHNGTTYESVVHIGVRWGFMSLPFGVLLGGCLFCLFSMLETRRLRLPAWKGSSLAGLTHGLDAEAREHLREMGDISKHAKRVKIRMVDSMLGPELVLSNNLDPVTKAEGRGYSTDGEELRGTDHSHS